MVGRNADGCQTEPDGAMLAADEGVLRSLIRPLDGLASSQRNGRRSTAANRELLVGQGRQRWGRPLLQPSDVVNHILRVAAVVPLSLKRTS